MTADTESTAAMPPAPSDARPILVEVEGVCKEFEIGQRVLPVLQDVDLTIRAGEMVTIIGASGAGKSTFLHCLGTLDLPTRGAIRFEGMDVTGLSPVDLAAFRNQTIGFVFQFHHLLPDFSALENVMMPALIARRPRREARASAEEMLASVGMDHRLRHRPGELSGGEQQRVAIARALLFRLNEARGLTVLIVTHNMELAAQMPRCVRMADGRISSAGDVSLAASSEARGPG